MSQVECDVRDCLWSYVNWGPLTKNNKRTEAVAGVVEFGCHEFTVNIWDWGMKSWEKRITFLLNNSIIIGLTKVKYFGLYKLYLGQILGLNVSQFSSVQLSRSVMSDSLQPHEPQHTRPPCPSPTPRVHPNPYPLSWRCHPTISSSVVPFSCPQSFPALGFFKWVSSKGRKDTGRK